MKKGLTKLLSSLLAFCLALTLTLPALAADSADANLPAAAADAFVYVALGDSVATGYTLDSLNPEDPPSNRSYAAFIAGDSEFYNLAQNGMDSTELAELLQDPAVLGKVEKADLVTISIGGNDLLSPLLKLLVPGFDFDNMDFSYFEYVNYDIPTLVKSMGLDNIELLSSAFLKVVGSLSQIISDFTANLQAIVASIRAVNPDAKIIVQTVFNPYRESAFFKDYESSFDAVMSTLNKAVKAGAESGGYLVADVYAAFEASGEPLLNCADPLTFYDPHPNILGHAVIAKTLIETAQAAGITLPERRPFIDVPEDSSIFESTKAVYGLGLMNGMADCYFGADGSLTRAMAVAVIYRMAGNNGTAPTAGFSDVAKGAWYESYVNWAAESGIVTGYADGTFRPDDLVTREQLSAILYRYLGSPAVTGSLTASDADTAGAWAKDALLWAVQGGMLTAGSDGSLSPKDPATRGDTAVMLAAAVK